MQREAPLTPKSKRINRFAPRTPDRCQNAASETSTVARARTHKPLNHHRTTMAPGDFAVPAPGLFGKKRLPSSRQSIMPVSHSQSFLDTTRRPEPENKDTEMRLLYDKYLRAAMVEACMRKKAEDDERALVSQLGMLAKEEDALNEKLNSMKAKESDLKSLVELQNGVDNNFAELTASLEEFENKPVEILSQLKSTLESLDTLRCKNLVVPETEEGMFKLRDYLLKCSETLDSIHKCIGGSHDTVCTLSKDLKSLTSAHTDVKDLAQKSEEALCGLQVLVLKDAARSVCCNKLQM